MLSFIHSFITGNFNLQLSRSFEATLALIAPFTKTIQCNIRVYRDFFSCIYNIYAQNIDGKYMLEPPLRRGTNEYLKSMFWKNNKKKKKWLTPAYPGFAT